MDDFEMSGEILNKTLDYLARINKWLGGNRVTMTGLKRLLKNSPPNREISIIDLGCGNGDMLRKIAQWGRKKGFTFKLLGIDANQATIDYAKALSAPYPEISYQKQDVLSDAFPGRPYDIALCTLFLHHFEDEMALNLIDKILKNANIGLIINDLHRHPLAYYLFSLLAPVIRNEMAIKDGLTSILKSFKREDLESFAKQIPYKSIINWRWAFRYQWIITKK